MTPPNASRPTSGGSSHSVSRSEQGSSLRPAEVDAADDSSGALYPALTDTVLTSIWTEQSCQQIERGYLAESRLPVQASPESPDSRDALPLYKYRTIDPHHPEWTEEILRESKLWSPSLRDLNDPLEAAVAFGGAVDEWAVPSLTMLFQSQWCGCICFTYDPVCVQMWAHYANSHSGFVVKYERADNWLLRSGQCQPMKYRRRLAALEAQELAVNALWTKSEAWEYEKEVRLQYPRTGAYTAAGLLKPSGIIFGLRTSDADKDFLRSVSPNLRHGQIVFAGSPYQLKVKWHD